MMITKPEDVKKKKKKKKKREKKRKEKKTMRYNCSIDTFIIETRLMEVHGIKVYFSSKSMHYVFTI